MSMSLKGPFLRLNSMFGRDPYEVCCNKRREFIGKDLGGREDTVPCATLWRFYHFPLQPAAGIGHH